MRKLLTFLLILSTFSSIAQKNATVADIQPVWGVDSNDIISFMQLLELEASKYTISQKFKDYYCNVLIHEYRKGQLVGSYSARDSLIKAAADFDYAFSVEDGRENGKFEVSFYSQKIGDSLLKIYSGVGRMAFVRKLTLDKNVGYSWKEVFNQPSKKHELKPGELYPLLTYSRAVGKEHAKYEHSSEFCRISGELIPFQDWYKDLGIEHYYIFFIRLEK